MGAVIDEFAERSDALLQGRRTYLVSAAAWPERSGKFADWINGAQKYVVSDTHTKADVTSWTPTTIIRSAHLLKEVPALRDQPGGDIYVYGSLSVARTLLTAGLVDQLVLMIEPITLGGARPCSQTMVRHASSSSRQRRPRAPAYRSAATGAPASSRLNGVDPPAP